MRTASKLLAMVVVLCASEAFAVAYYTNPNLTYRASFYGMTFGFNHLEPAIPGPRYAPYTLMSVGPLGNYEVPFTTTQGMIGFCVILAMMILLPVAATIRWRKKWVAP